LSPPQLTTQYKNWLTKVTSLGFTEDGACGLAMLYQWNLTHQGMLNPEAKSDDYIPLGFEFVPKDLFETILSDLSPNDISMILELFRHTAKTFSTNIPEKRINADGYETHFFDYEKGQANEGWQWEFSSRHNFDIAFMHMLGCAIKREELRKPYIAFAMAEFCSQFVYQVDPSGFRPIIIDLLFRPSPLIAACINPRMVSQIGNFEPLEIALSFFETGKPNLDEVVWNSAKTYLYDQKNDDHLRINNDIEFLSLDKFFDVVKGPIHQYLGEIINYIPSLKNEVPDVYQRNGDKSLETAVIDCMEKVFNVSNLNTFGGSFDRLTTLMLNGVLHSVLCYVLIRNAAGVTLQ
jgi:hypothetical protein